ncbi:MAG: citrate lyase acyl carrier protein [Eubacteriales bacterium]
MKLQKPAVAGTLESSDVQITVEPCANGVEIDLDSIVKVQFGDQIIQTTHQVLAQMEVTEARISIMDKGALDSTLRARLQCALCRASEQSYPWGEEGFL